MKGQVGVIGCGYWGKNLIRNFHEIGALKAICDIHDGRLHHQASQYREVEVWDDPPRFFAHPSISAVVIATPAETHYELARKALLAGKDVFVEKPLALKVEEGEELVRLAERAQRILMVGHLLEHHCAVLKLESLVQGGELGQIHYIYSNRLNLGKVRREENILWSFAPHDISVLLMLTGELPVEVSATGGSYLQKGIADVTVTDLLFSGGTRGHIFVSWLHPYKEHKLVVVGSSKMAVFDDVVAEGKLKIIDKGIEWVNGDPIPRKKAETVLFLPDSEPLRNECLHFLEAVEKRMTPRTDGHNGLRVLRVLEAAQESMEAGGRPVRVRSARTEAAVGY